MTPVAIPEGTSPARAAAPSSCPAATPADTAPNSFAALGLAAPLLAAVADLGFATPTPVQQAAIPLALGGASDPSTPADLLVSSQTGSGKTAAFLLPVLHTLLQLQEQEAHTQPAAEGARTPSRGGPRSSRPRRGGPRRLEPATPGALVLCPTRELAQQVAHDAIDLVRHCRGLRVAHVVGGMPYAMQLARLDGARLVVATPGRLLDLHRSGHIRLDGVQFLVVDEADRMLDLGFADDLADIHALTAQRRQTMMFSATFAPRIQQLAMRVMHDGGAHVQKVQIATAQDKHAHIAQSLYWADTPAHKRALLDHWLREPSLQQAIVFACTQIECDALAQELQQAGYAAVALHGALSQGMRNRRLAALREGRVQILVATDVAARGIDVPGITHVINYGLPMKAEDYTHRIGRTGRAGRQGLAVTLAEFRDRRRVADIEHHTQQPLHASTIPGLEPKGRFPASFFAGRNGKPHSGPRRPWRDEQPEGRPPRHGGPARADEHRGTARFDRHPDTRRPPRAPSRADGRFDDRFDGRFDSRFENRGDRLPSSPHGHPRGGERLSTHAGHGSREGGPRWAQRRGRG